MHPAASIRSNSATPMTATAAATNTARHYSEKNNNRPRKAELPTDSRPERTQRPEDLRRAQYLVNSSSHSNVPKLTDENGKPKQSRRNPKNCWATTSWILTWWAPPLLLRTFGKLVFFIIGKRKPILYNLGIKDKNMQQAWREKVSLVQVIIFLCCIVGFLTFGFNATVCGRQANRILPTGVEYNHIVISGRAFDLKSFRHPTPVIDMPGSGDIQELGIGGRDLSFLFQTVNYNCKGILKPIIADDEKGNVANYFPCVTLDRYSPKVNGTDNPERNGCHISTKSRLALRRLDVVGDVYYNWTDIQKPGTSLIAFNG
jgi:chitin synthase